MDPALRRRFDALLVLASALVGAEAAALFTAETPATVVLTVILAVLIAVLSLSYVYADRGHDVA